MFEEKKSRRRGRRRRKVPVIVELIVLIHSSFCLLHLVNATARDSSAAHQRDRQSKGPPNSTTPLPSPGTPKKKDIWLLGLFPLRGSWPGGLGQLPAVEIGLEDVNNHPHILPGYSLRMTMDDTRCDAGLGTNLLYRQLYTRPVKTLVLGAGCSAVSQATAQVSHLWNLVQLSYSSASPALSDKKIYQKFLRVFPPESSFNSAKFDLLDLFNWKKVGTIHQSVELFSMTTLEFVNGASSRGVQVLTSESFVNDPRQQVKNLKKQGVRIVVGNFYENFARVIFCEAFKEKMYGSKYAWIITGFFSPDWWKNTTGFPQHDCTVDQLEEAMRGYFTADALPFSHSNTTGISGKTYHEFDEQYKQRTGGRHLTGHQEAPYGYDSVWTVAKIFNESIAIMQRQGWNRSLEDFNYDDEEMSDLFWNVSSSLKFQGVSGLVMFDSKGDRQGLSQIEQFQDSGEVQVGIYDPSITAENKIVWDPSKKIIWQGGVPPPDSIIEKVTTKVINVGLFLLVTTLASLGMILSCSFLFFNIKYKRCKYIKMSSPNMNNAILLGAVVTYSSMIFAGIDSNLASAGVQLIACQFFHWTLALGFSLAFGAMFSKTWRVHKIFTNKKTQKMVIRDYQLLGIVCMLVLVDVVVLVNWQVFDPLYVTSIIKSMEFVNDPDNDNQVLIPQNQFCESNYMWYFAGVLWGIKGLLLLFGAFLAYETRKVTVPALNDSKFIGISVYNVMVLCLIGVPTAVMIRDQVDAAYLLTSLFTFFATTLTICLVFIPKTLKRNREPQTRSMWLKAKEAARAAAIANSSASDGRPEVQVQSFGPANDLQSFEGQTQDTDVEHLRQENERLRLSLQKCCRLLNEKCYDILPFGELPSPQTQSEEMLTPTFLCMSTSMPAIKTDKQ